MILCPEDLLLVSLVGLLSSQDITIDTVSRRLTLSVIGGVIIQSRHNY